jgi:hypothetical protein
LGRDADGRGELVGLLARESFVEARRADPEAPRAEEDARRAGVDARARFIARLRDFGAGVRAERVAVLRAARAFGRAAFRAEALRPGRDAFRVPFLLVLRRAFCVPDFALRFAITNVLSALSRLLPRRPEASLTVYP